MKKSNIECVVRGNQYGTRLYVSGMSKEEYNIFFRAGLQAFANKEFPGKIVVLDSKNYKPRKPTKTYEMSDAESDVFVRDGILIALKEKIAESQKSELIDYIRKHKKVRGVSKEVKKFYTEYE